MHPLPPQAQFVGPVGPLGPAHDIPAGTSFGNARGVRRFNLGGKGAFTLVEVTLAIGIVSFAFVAMFGLLPVGMSVAKQAMDTTVEAQIVQQLKAQALQTDFSQLEELADADPYYFDEQGKPADPSQSIYKAQFAVAKTTELPDSATQTVTTNKLATISIAMLNTHGNPTLAASDPTTSPDARRFSLLIPDNGL